VRLLRERSTAPQVEPKDTALLSVVPALVEDSVLVEELATTVEAEALVGGGDVSLVDEIAQAECLVTELDAEVHGGTPVRERWRNADGKTDDDLVMEARAGSDAALCELLNKYRAFARVKARSYFLVGADREDIVQEGMIGLYKAIRDFRSDRQASFRGFAELCITRQIITAIKTATRHKHQALNQYVSISGVRGGDDAGERSIEEMLDDHHEADPAEHVVAAQRMDDMRRSMAEMLSGLEVDVLRLYVEGKSYQEISEQLGRHVKSIDNALQRIKRKLDVHLTERDAADAAELVLI
jgi:RNA polymerase sporulation-specific sigma factor